MSHIKLVFLKHIFGSPVLIHHPMTVTMDSMWIPAFSTLLSPLFKTRTHANETCNLLLDKLNKCKLNTSTNVSFKYGMLAKYKKTSLNIYNINM